MSCFHRGAMTSRTTFFGVWGGSPVSPARATMGKLEVVSMLCRGVCGCK